MRRIDIGVLIAAILILLLVPSPISNCLLVSNVTLTSSGTISYSAFLTANPHYAYTLATNSTANYVLAKNGTVLSSSSNPVTAFATATTYANGNSLYVSAGTYTGSRDFQMQSCSNEQVVFDPNAVFTISNNLANWLYFNTVLVLLYDQNCTVTNATINGNAQNQNTIWLTNGILIVDSGNCTIVGANISNVKRDGFGTSDNYPGDAPNGIINSTVTAYANCICLGSIGTTVANFAINNTCYGCGDVGITDFGANDLIEGNYVHDILGTNGDGGNAHWGIAVEGAYYSSILNNIVSNCGTGIELSQGNSTLVKGNIVSNCGDCIGGSDVNVDLHAEQGFNVITNNTLTNWGAQDTPYPAGIWSYGLPNSIISFNTLKGTANQTGIWCWATANSSICNNTITIDTTGTSTGILLQSATNNTLIEGNNIQAAKGIYILFSSCLNNKISQNTLTNCTTPYTNSGTGTQINPTSSATYTLTFNNPYDGSAEGTYVYSNSTTISISLPSGSVLNVDGLNVTLTNNAYTLTMNKDHFAYAIGGTVAISNPS